MTNVDERAIPFLRRLEDVRIRLGRLSTLPAPGALTEPDPRRGERWEWGQVWAHVAEFPAYWIDQMIRILAGGDLTPFGRVQSDPGRLAAIESDRATPPAVLWTRIRPDLDRTRDLIERLTPADWSLRGTHSTLGTLDLPGIVEEFVVGHLEQHADQLDGLLAAGEA